MPEPSGSTKRGKTPDAQGRNGAEAVGLEIQQRVGRRVRELRQASAMTAVALANATGISQGQLSKIENGRVTLSIKTLAALCQVLGRPVSYLFQTEEEMPRVLGTLTTVAGPENQGIQHFAAQVRRRTAGRMSLIPLRPGQIGAAPDQVAQLQAGGIDLFIEELFYYQRFVPHFGAFALPYTFESDGHLQAFLQSPFFADTLRAPLLKAGIRFLNPRWNWHRGLEWVLVARTPIFTPDQIRGCRVRVPDSALAARYWQALGAEPVVVPWAEVRRALREKRIDVLPTHKSHLYPLRFCKYARCVTRLGDVAPVLGVAINEARFKILTPDIQNVLEKVCDEVGDRFSETVRAAETENEALNIRQFKAAYLKVNIDDWRSAARRASDRMCREGLLPSEMMAQVRALAAQGR